MVSLPSTLLLSPSQRALSLNFGHHTDGGLAPTGYNPDSAKQKKKEKHAAANYSEAWVEFLDKGVAKTVAKMLNAQVIGGKKGDK